MLNNRFYLLCLWVVKQRDLEGKTSSLSLSLGTLFDIRFRETTGKLRSGKINSLPLETF